MYYIVREGIKRLADKEFHDVDLAKSYFKARFDFYQKLLEQNVIPCFTCLLLTKGVRENEKTESIKY